MNYKLSTSTLNIYCDGGSRGNPGPAASAFIVLDEFGKIMHQQGFFLGVATNNQAEYQAVIEALKWLTTMNPQLSTLNFYLDSQLVVNQIKGIYKIKNPDLKIKNLEIQKLIAREARRSRNCKLKISNFEYIPRTQNHIVDKLVNQTLDKNASKL